MLERFVKNTDGSRGRVFSLLRDEATRLCRPGAGADTCIRLVMGKGFECLYYNRRVPSLTGEILEDRWKSGSTVAKRDGCNEIRKHSTMKKQDLLATCPKCGNQNMCPDSTGSDEPVWSCSCGFCEEGNDKILWEISNQ